MRAPEGSPAEITPDFSDDLAENKPEAVQVSWRARASYVNAKGQGHKHGSLYNIHDESSISATANCSLVDSDACTVPTAS